MRYLIRFLLRHVPRKYLQLFNNSLLRMAGLFYRGSKVECPVCSHHYRTFLPYGRLKTRKNALCPNCLSLERHRLLWLYLKNKIRFFNEKLKVLHIAPEICFMKRFEKMDNLDYVTADIESPLAKVKMDIHHIPFDENTFDVVLCNHVMEHVDNDLIAMKEIFRVLKTGGWAIIQVPFFHPVPDRTYEDRSITLRGDREKVFGQDDHVRKYGKDYTDRLRLAGFDVKEDNYIQDIDHELVARYALPADEIIYLCRKDQSKA